MGDQHRSRLLVMLVATAMLASCDRNNAPAPPASSSPAVVVASFNFPESELLADIYADALTAAGIPVHAELNLGPRELVMPAFQAGLVDVVPEYIGSALVAAQPGLPIDMADPTSVSSALGAVLSRWNGRVLTPSPAQDQNGLAVTTATAGKYRLRTISDLRPVAGRLTIAGPSECPQRPYCLLGLEATYGLHFDQFMAYDSDQDRVVALDQGVADVAVMFSTDGQLAGGDLVFLADDRRLQPADSVAPIVSQRAVARYGPGLMAALDRVSARLSTSELRFLNWRVAVAGRSAATEARGWLIRQGLVSRRAA